jgi:hypothetical protein
MHITNIKVGSHRSRKSIMKRLTSAKLIMAIGILWHSLDMEPVSVDL